MFRSSSKTRQPILSDHEEVAPESAPYGAIPPSSGYQAIPPPRATSSLAPPSLQRGQVRPEGVPPPMAPPGGLAAAASANAPNKKLTAAKRLRAARVATVRQKLNLPLDTDFQSQVEAARNAMFAKCVVESFDTKAFATSLPYRAVLIGDVVCMGLPGRVVGEDEDGTRSHAEGTFSDGEGSSDPRLQGELAAYGPPIAFFFPYGACVLWGFTAAEEKEVLDLAMDFSQDVLTNNDDEDRLEFGPSSLFSVTPASKAATESSGLGALYRKPFDRKNLSPTSSVAPPSLGLQRASSLGESMGHLEAGQGASNKDPLHQDRQQRRPASLDAVASANLAASAMPGVSFARTGASFVLNDPRDPFTKLSVSFAFAQSARLSVLENQLEELVETIRPIPEAMAQNGHMKFKRRDVAQLMGRTFLLSSAVNLYSDILDSPDFFWENSEYEPIYKRTSAYLDLEDRVRIINSRLAVIQNLLDNLTTQLANESSHHLEIIVILLIVVEVVLDLIRGGLISELFGWSSPDTNPADF